MFPNKRVSGFSFLGKGFKKKGRKFVTEQEEEGARLIKGRRHIGSGALEGLKSDASSLRWQMEAKQTAKKSIGVSLEWLDKISREARAQDKAPILFLRFTKIPEEMIMERDWVIISAKEFQRLEK